MREKSRTWEIINVKNIKKVYNNNFNNNKDQTT